MLDPPCQVNQKSHLFSLILSSKLKKKLKKKIFQRKNTKVTFLLLLFIITGDKKLLQSTVSNIDTNKPYVSCITISKEHTNDKPSIQIPDYNIQKTVIVPTFYSMSLLLTITYFQSTCYYKYYNKLCYISNRCYQPTTFRDINAHNDETITHTQDSACHNTHATALTGE